MNHPAFEGLYRPFMVNLGMVDPIALLKLAAEGCWFHTSGAPDCDGLSPGWSRSTSAKTLTPPGMPTGKIWKDWMMEDPNLDHMLIPNQIPVEIPWF